MRLYRIIEHLISLNSLHTVALHFRDRPLAALREHLLSTKASGVCRAETSGVQSHMMIRSKGSWQRTKAGLGDIKGGGQAGGCSGVHGRVGQHGQGAQLPRHGQVGHKALDACLDGGHWACTQICTTFNI